ncbi:MAG: hypothetical protein VST69_08520, partial [Nitrospirota bacterium]|nr:hypothetical protein [Nitrospirota bacterium]
MPNYTCASEMPCKFHQERSGPGKRDSSLSEIPEVNYYPTTGDKYATKETKSFTGIQSKSSASG